MRFWKILVIMAASLLLALVSTRAYAQFPTDNYTEVVEYCHIDVIMDSAINHRDFTEKITITKDKMIIYLEGEDKFEFELEGFAIIDGQIDRNIRKVVRTDKTDSLAVLAAMYIQGQFVSVKNMDSGGTVFFYLKDACKTIPKTGDDLWHMEKIPKKGLKQTD